MKRSFERYDILILNDLKNGFLKRYDILILKWFEKKFWKMWYFGNEALKGYDILIY